MDARISRREGIALAIVGVLLLGGTIAMGASVGTGAWDGAVPAGGTERVAPADDVTTPDDGQVSVFDRSGVGDVDCVLIVAPGMLPLGGGAAGCPADRVAVVVP